MTVRDRLRTHSTAGSGVIQAWDVDPRDARPDGEFEKKTKRHSRKLDRARVLTSVYVAR
jgi:hypothetical protein